MTMAGERRRSGKKPESSRRREIRAVDIKGHPNEYDHLREDLNKTWTGWLDGNSNMSDVWRRIEQSGLDNALKKLASVKPELTVISGLSSDDAENVTSVMVEFCELLNTIRLAFVENEKEILDSDEREKRYLKSSSSSIVNIWSGYSMFAANYATTFISKGWLNSSEHRELLTSLNEVVASSVKLIVLSVNMADYHCLDDTDMLLKAAIQDSTSIAKDTEAFLANCNELGEKHAASDELLEILGWMLNGLYHMSNKVLKVGIEAKEPESSLDEYDTFIESLTSLTKSLQTKWGEPPKEVVVPQTEKTVDKKSSKRNNKKKKGKVEPSKDTKPAEPPQEENKKSKDGYLDVILKYSNAYKQFSDDAWQSKRLPSIKGTSDVQMKYRTENYNQIGKLKIDACAVTQRKQILEEFGLTDTDVLHSDIYVISPDPLSCTEEVIIQFPLHTVGNGIRLKMKADGQMKDIENPEIAADIHPLCVYYVPGNPANRLQIPVAITDTEQRQFITFNTTSCEAFTAMSVSKCDTIKVSSQAFHYVSKENGKVEIDIPEGTFDSEVTVDVSVLEFEQGNRSDSFVGIVSATEAVMLTCKDAGVDMKKYITIQLPMSIDEDDKDTELVVARCNDQDVQILDKRQFAIKHVSRGGGLYSVDIRGFWCVAILRIKRIFLNMRETIKKEFQIGFGVKHPCSILTFIDDLTRGEERQTFVIDVVEKKDADNVVENKKQLGLIEVKKSRSKDILLQRGDQVRLQIDGQMRGTEAMTEQDLTLCYLYGCSNVIFVETEIKRDPDKLPDAMIFFKQPNGDSTLHSVAIMTRDLAESPTDEITARSATTTIKTDQKKGKVSEESAAQILKMESLMCLARELTVDEGCQLGEQLGVKSEVIKQITERQEKDHVGANFQILCEWRGRSARATMADFLVSSLKAMGKIKYADLVTEVRKHSRSLERTDFQLLKKRQRNKPA